MEKIIIQYFYSAAENPAFNIEFVAYLNACFKLFQIAVR